MYIMIHHKVLVLRMRSKACLAARVSLRLARMTCPACQCQSVHAVSSIHFTQSHLITALHTTPPMHCTLFFQMLWREETVSYMTPSTSITKVQVIVWRLPASLRLPMRLVTVIATLSVSSSGTTVRLFESRDDRRGGGSLDMMIQGGLQEVGVTATSIHSTAT